jgi:hypothetical protein
MKVCIVIVVIRKEEEEETVCSNPYGKAVKEATASREQEQFITTASREQEQFMTLQAYHRWIQGHRGLL